MPSKTTKKAARKTSRKTAKNQRRKPTWPKETPQARRLRTRKILRQLHKAHPEAHCALQHVNPLELLIATILSAQCTDERVNKVTPVLFEKYRTASDYATASRSELEAIIRSTGFFRAKAKSIQGCCQAIVEKHAAEVPSTLEELTQLPGVGRKTANVILGNAFDTPGLVVDTHVKRISNRLGLTTNQDPVKIEFDLMPLVPEKDWTFYSHAVIFHGRQVCAARKPLCQECNLSALCPSANSV
jgi:endonuclease-3